MTCENRVYYVVPSNGYDYREVSVACGRTDYYGQQRFCGDCAKLTLLMSKTQQQTMLG